MNDELYKEAMYQGFFDELSKLERQQLLEKQAAGIFRQIAGGFRRIGKKGVGATANRLERAYKSGAGRAGNQGAGGFGRAMGGVRSVLRTREGKALATAGLGGAAAIGGAGMAAGYGMGRAQGQ